MLLLLHFCLSVFLMQLGLQMIMALINTTFKKSWNWQWEHPNVTYSDYIIMFKFKVTVSFYVLFGFVINITTSAYRYISNPVLYFKLLY